MNIKEIESKLETVIDELHYALTTGDDSNREHYIKNAIRFAEEAKDELNKGGIKMICIRCNSKNTKCFDDMLTISSYIAEIYKCYDCNGEIEVVYDGKISNKHIKEYRYVKKT